MEAPSKSQYFRLEQTACAAAQVGEKQWLISSSLQKLLLRVQVHRQEEDLATLQKSHLNVILNACLEQHKEVQKKMKNSRKKNNNKNELKYNNAIIIIGAGPGKS